MSDKQDMHQLSSEFVQLWGHLAGFWGITPASGRVVGWLISRSEAAGAEEIGEALEMSRGAVSMATRELVDWGLVRTEKLPGTRRLLYHTETELEKVIRNIIQTRKRREWDPILEHIERSLPQLRGQKSKDASAFRERLEEIQTVITAVDDMAASFLAGGVIEKLGLKFMLGKARKGLRKKQAGKKS